jgi:hypothetical protein
MNTTTTRPAAGIEPFWMRLRAITTYPLQMSALSTIGLYAVLRILSLWPGMGGRIIGVAISAALYKYASDVLIATAHGRMKAPEGWQNSEDNTGWIQVKLQAMLMVIAVVAMMLLPLPLAIVALVFIAFAAPGATMSAATDMNLWHALNPATWLAIMGRLGWPYFVVALLCGVIALSQVNAQALLLPFLPLPVAIVVLFFISHYATIVTFHLMGYLIYQYHEELGWVVEGEVTLKRPADVDQDVLDAAEAFAADGKLDAAEAHLADHLTHRGGSAAVHDRYRKLLALRGDNAALLKHGRDYLNVLMAQNADRKALDLARECLAIDKTFQPSAAEFVNRLAQRAADLGMTQLALDLLSGFHRAFPRHGDTPKNYLLAAKLMAEKMNAEAKAAALLTQVKQAFPTHPLLPEIESYLKFLEALAAPKRAMADA